MVDVDVREFDYAEDAIIGEPSKLPEPERPEGRFLTSDEVEALWAERLGFRVSLPNESGDNVQ